MAAVIGALNILKTPETASIPAALNNNIQRLRYIQYHARGALVIPSAPDTINNVTHVATSDLTRTTSCPSSSSTRAKFEPGTVNYL